MLALWPGERTDYTYNVFNKWRLVTFGGRLGYREIFIFRPSLGKCYLLRLGVVRASRIADLDREMSTGAVKIHLVDWCVEFNLGIVNDDSRLIRINIHSSVLLSI